jgi:hypothetical protein
MSMGTLVAKHYPTKLFLKAADHTYVECGTGGKGWSCWGGKTGGKVLRRAVGSTNRADKIARPNERAGIKCYLINGVCHQAANRILLPAGITVRGARGYPISQAIFGPYGRIGSWPCKSPFNKFSTTTGDLPQCTVKKAAKKKRAVRPLMRSGEDKADWQYIQRVLTIYSEGEKQEKLKTLTASNITDLNVRLFMCMVDFELGPILEKKQTANLVKMRKQTEVSIQKAQAGLEKLDAALIDYIHEINAITTGFQDNMANLLSAADYEALFGLKPDERIILADPKIVKAEYGITLNI